VPAQPRAMNWRFESLLLCDSVIYLRKSLAGNYNTSSAVQWKLKMRLLTIFCPGNGLAITLKLIDQAQGGDGSPRKETFMMRKAGRAKAHLAEKNVGEHPFWPPVVEALFL